MVVLVYFGQSQTNFPVYAPGGEGAPDFMRRCPSSSPAFAPTTTDHRLLNAFRVALSWRSSILSNSACFRSSAQPPSANSLSPGALPPSKAAFSSMVRM
jgi:hypothetical protein